MSGGGEQGWIRFGSCPQLAHKLASKSIINCHTKPLSMITQTRAVARCLRINQSLAILDHAAATFAVVFPKFRCLCQSREELSPACAIQGQGYRVSGSAGVQLPSPCQFFTAHPCKPPSRSHNHTCPLNTNQLAFKVLLP